MKHFIYMDNDIINSYISQYSDGLVMNTHSEVEDKTSSIKTETSTEPSKETNLKFSLPPIFNLGATDKDQIISTATTLTQLQSGRELVDKLVLDNAFNQLYKYLKNNNLIKWDNYRINDYISVKGDFDFWDLDYLLSLLNGSVINFSIKSAIEAKNTESLKNRNKPLTKSEISYYKKQFEDQYDTIKDLIGICKDIMPCTKFMMINDCFVPLNEKYLREPIKSIRFKYTGTIVLVGQYTNDYNGIKSTGENSAMSQIFNGLDEIANAFFKETLNIPDYAEIITPIALYFE